MERIKVGILGATGMVGQRLVERCASHPWFELRVLGASERSVGKSYREAARWRISADPPEPFGGFRVVPCDPDAFRGCSLVLSGLDAESGRRAEADFARAGYAVVSNSSAHRMEPDVPLLIPEINASHLALLALQQTRYGPGCIVTNPNCSVTGLALVLASLHRAFGVTRVVAVTLQALSGAGLEGPRALETADNVIPYIAGEEEKIETEVSKILGVFDGSSVRPAPIRVSAHCHRVGTFDGHLEAVSTELASPCSPEDASAVLREFRGEIAGLDLPSAPGHPIVVRGEADRPQPRLDRDTGGGMSVVVGRIRPCPVLSLRFELLSHNAVRGAAGAALLNAELLVARGLLPARTRP